MVSVIDGTSNRNVYDENREFSIRIARHSSHRDRDTLGISG